MGAINTVTGFFKDPVTTTGALMVLANLIMFGLGVGWYAVTLRDYSLINLVALLFGLANHNFLLPCVRKRIKSSILKFAVPLATTASWGACVVTGQYMLEAFRCLRGQPTGSGCSNIDVTNVKWVVELPWTFEWVRPFFQWFVDFVNLLPEGLSYVNFFGGILCAVISVFAWDWSFGSSGPSTEDVLETELIERALKEKKRELKQQRIAAEERKRILERERMRLEAEKRDIPEFMLYPQQLSDSVPPLLFVARPR